MRDNDDRMVELLETIARNVGGGAGGSTEATTPDQRSAPESGVKIINPRKLLVGETDDLDESNDLGELVLEPGESGTIVELAPKSPAALYSVGASDVDDVSYQLVLDDTMPVGRRTVAPFGPYADPFSFVDNWGGAIPFGETVAYKAFLSPDAGSSVKLVGKMYGEGF